MACRAIFLNFVWDCVGLAALMVSDLDLLKVIFLDHKIKFETLDLVSFLRNNEAILLGSFHLKMMFK